MTIEVPAVDYESHGVGYAGQRRTDPRIAAYIDAGLGDARSVVNIGAGTGSYEPTDRYVVAVEPAATMRAQRPAGYPPAIRAVAQDLPLDDAAVDAAMAVLTVHHWSDPAAGLTEVRRVTRGPVVVLTFDPAALDRLWLMADWPEIGAVEARRFPAVAELVATLAAGGATVDVTEVPIPLDCVDGIHEAYYGRPEAFLDPVVRASQSNWPTLPAGLEDRFVAELREELESGRWDARHGHLRRQAELRGAVRLIVARP